MQNTPPHARIISVTGLAIVMVSMASVLELVVKPASIRRLRGDEGRDPVEALLAAGWTSRRFDSGVYHLELRDRDAPTEAEMMILGEVRGLHSLTIQNVNLTAAGTLKRLMRLPSVTKDVRVLDFSNSVLGDLFPLTGLRSVSTLSLNGCSGYPSLAPVSEMTTLTSLYLGNTPDLTDLRPVSGLFALKSLYLADCPSITDLSPISDLSNLEELNLMRCKGVTDLAPLAGLKRLTRISLAGCTGIVDIRPLGGLTELREISLAGCSALEEIEPLSNLPNLQRVNLTDCPMIRHIPAALRGNPRLKIVRSAADAAE